MRLSLNPESSRGRMQPMSPIVPLNSLAQGCFAEVADIVGSAEQVQRIKELGFGHGENLEMVRAGSPCIVRLRNQTLCIRGNELLNVLVRPGA